jgi:hypothetical protein
VALISFVGWLMLAFHRTKKGGTMPNTALEPVILRVKIPRLFAGSKSPTPETLVTYHIVLSDQGLSAAS